MGGKSIGYKFNKPALIAGSMLACTLFGDSLLYGVLPVYAENLGVPLIFVGIILSINRWIRLVSNQLAGQLYRAFGLHRPLVAVCILTVITIIIYAYPASLFWLLGARILWGICWSHLRLGSELVVISTAPGRLGLAMGTLQATSRMGSAFALLAGGALIDNIGYSSGFIVMAGLSAFSIPLAFLLHGSLRQNNISILLESKREKNAISQKVRREEVRSKASSAGLIPPFLCHITAFINSFINRGLVIASISLVLQARMTEVISLAGMTLGIATVAGALLSSRWLSSFIISPLTGHFSDRWGRSPFLLTAFNMEIITLLIIAMTSSPLMTSICAILLFMAGNTIETVIRAAVAEESHGGSIPVRMGIHATFDDIGSAAGPLIGYLLAGIIGFPLTYNLGAILVLALFLIHITNHYLIRITRSGTAG